MTTMMCMCMSTVSNVFIVASTVTAALAPTSVLDGPPPIAVQHSPLPPPPAPSASLAPWQCLEFRLRGCNSNEKIRTLSSTEHPSTSIWKPHPLWNPRVCSKLHFLHFFLCFFLFPFQISTKTNFVYKIRVVNNGGGEGNNKKLGRGPAKHPQNAYFIFNESFFIPAIHIFHCFCLFLERNVCRRAQH